MRRFLLGVILSGLLLLLIVYQVDFNQLIASLKSVSYPSVVMAVLVLSSTQLIKSWRWKYLLKPVKSVRTFDLLPATTIGAMADMIFPARTGEFVRAYLIGQKEQVSKVASLATIVVEKVFDILILLLIAIIMLVYMNLSAQTSLLPVGFDIGVYIFALLILLLWIGLWLIMTRVEQIVKLTRIWSEFLPKRWQERIKDTLKSFALGLKTIKKGRHLVSVIILSLLLWSTFALGNFLILRSFGLQLPPYAPFFFLIFQILGVTIPSSPGFIGTYHAAVVAGFTVFQVSQELALSVAIIMHAAFFFPFIFLGFIFLWRENLSFQEFRTVRFMVQHGSP